MTMYIRKGNDLEPIPEDHEKVLGQYRDSMPLVWEPQHCGDSFPLYPLIDEDEEPYGAPLPCELERLARTTAFRLKLARLGEEPFAPPQFEQMATAAIRAHLADWYKFAVAMHFQDDPEGCIATAGKDMTRVAREMSGAVTRLARAIIAEKPPVPMGPCADQTIGR